MSALRCVKNVFTLFQLQVLLKRFNYNKLKLLVFQWRTKRLTFFKQQKRLPYVYFLKEDINWHFFRCLHKIKNLNVHYTMVTLTDSHNEAYKIILSNLIKRHRVTPGLDSTKALLTAAFGSNKTGWDLDNIIHVAGTNGKGSVTHKIAGGLIAKGYKVGMFTSPHLLTVRERLTINGECISKSNFINLFNRMENLMEEHHIEASFFEILTVMAIQFFYEGPSFINGQTCNSTIPSPSLSFSARTGCYCDYIVLETGLGGALDATNVMSKPLCTIITSIGWDHMAILGNTMEEIAFQKAGILKPGSPVVLGPQATGFRAIEEKIDSLKRELPTTVIRVNATSDDGDDQYQSFHEENTLIAKAALDIILENKWDTNAFKLSSSNPKFRVQQLTKEEVTNALQHCSQFLKDDEKKLANTDSPLKIYIDVGHNITAIRRVVTDLQRAYPKKTFRVLCCLSKGRSISILEPYVNIFGPMLMGLHYLNSNHHRTRTFEDIKTEISTIDTSETIHSIYNVLVNSHNNISQEIGWYIVDDIKHKHLFFSLDELFQITVARVLYKAVQEQSIILFSGTFFMVQEILISLGMQHESDPIEVNERSFELKQNNI